MAWSSRHVLSELLIFRRIIVPGLPQYCFANGGTRNLYSIAALGVDNFSKVRDRVSTQFTNISDKFRSKMTDFCKPDNTNMIFTEDLKNMIYLAEGKREDMDLVVQMIKRFNQQNREMRFGNFVFGPVVMRMFHFLNEPVVALEAFKCPELDGFFDQLMSYQVLMNLLFSNKMYQEMLQVFEIIKEKQMQDARFPKNVVVLTLGACYKLNTPESLKYAMNIWKELQQVGHVPLRRATTFAAALALNQNSPQIALEIISGVRQQNYVTVRNIKAAALAEIGRIDDALPILRSVLEIDDPTQRKNTFTKDVLERLRTSIGTCDNKSTVHEFEQLVINLKTNGHIEDNCLDDLLCSEITVFPQTNRQGRDQQVLAATFTRRTPGQARPRNSYNRPGLQDLY